MAKISIFIGAHLCTAPRPQKEAEVLAHAGHQVTVYGIWFDPILVTRDQELLQNKPYQFQPLLDFRPQHRRTRLGIRLQARLSRELFRQCRIFTPSLCGYGAKAMVHAAKRDQADLHIFHSEAGLWAAVKLLQKNYRVGVDFEDWFSEDLLPCARKNRPIEKLQQLEKILLRSCDYKLTTSHVMATAMAQEAQSTPPTVIYNTFSKVDGRLVCRPKKAPLKLHWFSQTIGPGRGLELLFEALPLLTSTVEVHLRGHYPESSQRWMVPLIPDEWRSQIHIHPLVSNQELPQKIAEYDVGLALETPFCKSRDYTVTNKLFQYLQAGLATIATDTAGQREVMKQLPEAGLITPHNDAEALAKAIDSYAQDHDRLLSAKQAAYEAGQTSFCFENQHDILLEALNHTLSCMSKPLTPPGILTKTPQTVSFTGTKL